MLNKQLIEYIKSERAKGDDDEVIKLNLIENNWEEADIDEALEKVNSIDPDTPFDIEIKDREKVFVVDNSRSHPATEVKENVDMPIGDKPKVMPNVISALLVVISFLFIYKAGMMITIMGIVDRASYSTGTIYYFLKEFPLYGWVIMTFSLSASVFLYASFKIHLGTKSAFWLGVISLLLFPVSLSYINYKLMLSVANYFSSEAIILSQNAPKIPAGTSTLIVGVLGEPAFFISFVTLVILLISFKKFHYPEVSLSGKSRSLLLIFILLFTLPTAFVVFSGYSKAKNDDFGYKKAGAVVGYHIYRPDPIPFGMVYSTNFITGKELAGVKNAVQVTYDFAFEEALKIKNSRPIVLKQMGIKPDFSMDKFISAEGLGSEIKKIEVPIALNKEAYLLKKVSGTGKSAKNLVFITTDNVLISLLTVDSGEQDLVNIAVSLK